MKRMEVSCRDGVIGCSLVRPFRTWHESMATQLWQEYVSVYSLIKPGYISLAMGKPWSLTRDTCGDSFRMNLVQ